MVVGRGEREDRKQDKMICLRSHRKVLKDHETGLISYPQFRALCITAHRLGCFAATTRYHCTVQS